MEASLTWELLRAGLQTWIGNPEAWLVIYAAVVSTIALLWNVWRDFLTLRLRASVRVVLGPHVDGTDWRVILLVVNTSVSRTLFVTTVTASYRRLWGTRTVLGRISHWLRLPDFPQPGFMPKNTWPTLPQMVSPGQPLAINCPLGDPETWRGAKRIGVSTADGRLFWCSRANIRRFRDHLDAEDKEWITEADRQ